MIEILKISAKILGMKVYLDKACQVPTIELIGLPYGRSYRGKFRRVRL